MRDDGRGRHSWAKSRTAILAALLAALVLVPVALAQGGYEITSWTVDGGDGIYSGGDYRLAGTIGQHDAATWSGGDYTLAGGFWAGGAAGPGPGYEVFLPLVMRNH